VRNGRGRSPFHIEARVVLPDPNRPTPENDRDRCGAMRRAFPPYVAAGGIRLTPAGRDAAFAEALFREGIDTMPLAPAGQYRMSG